MSTMPPGPQGPPPGPWSSPAPPPPAPPRRGLGTNQVIALVVAFALIAGAVVGVIVVAGGGDSGNKPAATVVPVADKKEVFAEPVSTAQNPFSPPAGNDYPNMPAVRPTGGATTQYGGQPGLYGGTMDSSSCNKTQLVNFLTVNVDKATAWASTLGIQVSDIPTYVNGLTPVLLRSDTRVTNHGYVNGRATSIQVVLQAGTAVLIDSKGEPVTKCYCGNPLTPPIEYPPVYYGPKWPSFDPAGLTVIVQNTTVINIFTLVDPKTGRSFTTPAGSNGTPVAPPPAPVAPAPAPVEPAPAPVVPRPNPGPTDEQRARAKLDKYAAACYPFPNIPQDTLRSITYSQQTPTSFVLTRVGNLSNGGTQTFVWRIDRQTLVFTPLNDLAQRGNSHCPQFGQPGS
jgi:hypothetical protein